MRPTNDPARERYRAAVQPLLEELAAAGLRVDTDGQDVEAVALAVCDRYRSAA